MRLAAMGGRSVTALQNEMPASEIPLWIAGNKQARPEDFAPIFRRKPEYRVMSPEAIKMAILAAAPGVIDKRPKRHATDQPILSA